MLGPFLLPLYNLKEFILAPGCIGIYAPFMKKMKCRKIPEENSRIHLDILCAYVKFRENLTFFMACVKNKNLSCKKPYFSTDFFSFLHMSHKIRYSESNVGRRRM